MPSVQLKRLSNGGVPLDAEEKAAAFIEKNVGSLIPKVRNEEYKCWIISNADNAVLCGFGFAVATCVLTFAGGAAK